MSEQTGVPTELDHAEDRIDQLRQKLKRIRDLAADLYGNRGEDALTATRCSQIMAIADKA